MSPHCAVCLAEKKNIDVMNTPSPNHGIGRKSMSIKHAPHCRRRMSIDAKFVPPTTHAQSSNSYFTRIFFLTFFKDTMCNCPISAVDSTVANTTDIIGVQSKENKQCWFITQAQFVNNTPTDKLCPLRYHEFRRMDTPNTRRFVSHE
jgi:hypothetical protein